MFPTRRIITSGGDVYRDQYSLDFDGTDEYLVIGDHADYDITDDITMMCWVKPAATDAQWLMGKGDGSSQNYNLAINGSTKFNHDFYVSGTGHTVTSTTDVVAGVWYHVVITREKSSGTHVMYVNGVAEDIDTDSTSSIDNDDVGFTIGARDNKSLDFEG